VNPRLAFPRSECRTLYSFLPQPESAMNTPAQIRKRVRELEQEIAEIQVANKRDHTKKHLDKSFRYRDLERRQRLRRILEELSSLSRPPSE
jgi:hypothetical protein